MRVAMGVVGLFLLMAWFPGCGQEAGPKRAETRKKETAMELASSAFEDGGNIPSVYTCDGKNISPPLQISNVPNEAEALALVVDDPDAPGQTFDHWVVWNIPPPTTDVPEGQQPQGAAGENDFGDLASGGPCPPSGTHTYRFKLYALDARLELEEGSTKAQLQQAMEGHVLAQTVLEGNYSRE